MSNNKSIILCLDIDDCIFPTNVTHIGLLKDNLNILELNLKRLKILIEIYDIEIFITSSWFTILDLEDKNIRYKNKKYNKDKRYYYEEFEAFKLMSKYLNGYFIGKSKGDRFEDIEHLLTNKNNIVISLDDMDLSSINNDNYLYVEMEGFLTNRRIGIIKQFLDKKIK